MVRGSHCESPFGFPWPLHLWRNLLLRSTMKRLIRIILGCFLLLLGLAGLVLPLLQGWFFLAMGAIVLSRDVPLFARMERLITDRFPKAERFVSRLRSTFPLLSD
jgi:hypothetical protein